MPSGSWMDDVLADAENFPVARTGRATGVGDVVETFLENKAGFSAENVRSFVNSALQNEAGELIQSHAEVVEQSEAMELFAESLRQRQERDANFEPARSPDEIDTEVAAQIEASLLERDSGLVALGDLVSNLRKEGSVDLDTNTWQALDRADDLSGGAISEAMGQKVSEVRTQHAEDAFAGKLEALPSASVDFSRHAEVRQRDRTQSAPQPEREEPVTTPMTRAEGERLLRTTGMTKASSVAAAWMASHGRAPDGTPLGEASTTSPPGDGPSLG